ncbi:hypothetical protein F0U60_53210 [Archangium minus]|uniref:Uncharacterized protein n=1 Tax=Archangium minus TaxID=83450 RepID=A0ABY9X940_9BACT|nr:hypothetical protein F0U60_53210 [Archangium minus]
MNRDEMNRRVGAIRKAQERLSGSPEVVEALLPALYVSYFLLDGHGHNFEDYLAAFRGASLPFLGAFSSPEEFGTWLKTHFVPPPRGNMQIAGERYTLGYSRLNGTPLLLRLPLAKDLRRPGGAQGQERLWLALDQAEAVLSDSPEDLEGLHSAALALHFIHAAGCEREFSHFLAHFDEHLPPLCSFFTREEADAWLKNHSSPPHGASVMVGEDEFTVGYWPRNGHRVLLRVPQDEAFDDSDDEDQDPTP